MFFALWRWVILLTLLSATARSATTTEEKECTIHSDGKYYDLNPLKASKDYEISTEKGHKIVLNVCKAINTETWGLKVPNSANVGGVIRKDHGDFSIGEKNTTLVMSEGNPKLVLMNGSNCKGSDNKAGTIIEFKCDTKVFGAGTPRLITEWPLEDDDLACLFVMEWKTHFACPTGERGGPWGFFAVLAVLVTILVMVYLVLGTLYNRYVLNLRGFDQIPQFSLEAMKYHSREAVDWFRDVMSQLYEGGQRAGWGGNVPRSWGSGNAGFGGGSQLAPGGGFRRPNPRNTPVANSFSHQAQVDVGGGRESDGAERTPAAAPRTNPVSHQSQTSVAPAPAPAPQKPEPLPVKKFESAPSTAEERTFMLGDDDEEEDVIATPMTAAVNTSTRPSEGDSETIEGETIAQLRGRDKGEEGSIRL
ncbi:hypothetical protein GYMLUDRAFT_41547 [Collybiopsis luxurians FD-317 M1]|uniref:Autophagy-related protein 27 n=1 Tax=Collybiopsis luxurians FD-317 M1 TaxID=944289 RepID=A0A0D0D1Z0_9AGAR|nr:hypothetical protein GYMLUDRAFT_41547 [Collybiopsis luxurians FD-317 M1]